MERIELSAKLTTLANDVIQDRNLEEIETDLEQLVIDTKSMIKSKCRTYAQYKAWREKQCG